jgi:hypothetical protein
MIGIDAADGKEAALRGPMTSDSGPARTYLPSFLALAGCMSTNCWLVTQKR